MSVVGICPCSSPYCQAAANPSIYLWILSISGANTMNAACIGSVRITATSEGARYYFSLAPACQPMMTLVSEIGEAKGRAEDEEEEGS